MVSPHVAVEATLDYPVDPVLWRPVSFLVGDEEGAIGINTDAVGSAEPGGDDGV